MSAQYEAIRVKFTQDIESINAEMIERNKEAMGVSTVKEWIDSYEGGRFTQIGDADAIVTAPNENMFFIKAWFEYLNIADTIEDLN